jgi:GTP-binding protein
MSNKYTESESPVVARLEPPRALTLELALEFIDEDELIEVTPVALRLRKRQLDPTRRKKTQKDLASNQA